MSIKIYSITYKKTIIESTIANNGLTGNLYDASFSSITIAGARRINSKFNAGISVIHYIQDIYNTSYKNTALNAGAQYNNSDLTIDFIINNLFSTAAQPLREKEKMPAVIELGVSYEITDNLKAGIVFDKEEDRDIEMRAGLNYKFFDALRFNAGYIKESKQPAAGFNLLIKNIRLDYAFMKHKELDITHKLSIIIKL